MKKRSREKIIRRNTAICLLLGMFLNMLTFSDNLIRTRSGETVRVTTAPNGTPMIELANPNGSGISVNNFESLSVDERNLILNNISSKDGSAYRSELGGIIVPNENYSGNAARAILIRVHDNPSAINGFIEAASVKNVDMVFSNERGIYMNGGLAGRFGNVTFTTGRVTDDLMSIMVRDGRIEIGTGFNGNAAESLSLLAKELRINGQLHGNDLNLIGGQFDYNTGTKEIVKQGDNPNEILVSASSVGSIYGKNIYLVAIGSDIGVKGDVISQKVLKINADGSVVTNKIQGTESIDVKGKEFVQETSAYTEGKMKIDTDKAVFSGAGTQAGEIEVTGNLENNTDIYSKGNVIVKKDVKSKGQIISEGKVEIAGNLESDKLVYGKNEINVEKNLVNNAEMQSEGNINTGDNVTNTGKILSEKEVNIKGNVNNSGVLYGKNNVTLEKNLNNSGSVQTTGDLSVKDTINTGKLVVEGKISTGQLDNSGEVTANKKLESKSIENKRAGKISTQDGIIVTEDSKNDGQINTSGDFLITGNLENYNVINVGGLLTAKDLTNAGALKVSEKITARGITFTNSGEILTTVLDVDNTNISNTNKITVVETAKLKGDNINNQGVLAAKNVDVLSPVLINSGQILAEEKVTANNTNLTNTGKLASNGKIDLNNSVIVNRSVIESSEVNMNNLVSYDNNTGTIRGNNVTLATAGNLVLAGKLQGIDNLLISGLDITNAGTTVSSGLLRLSGRDIINNSAISASNVELLGTGNILNTSMIEGEKGKLSGNNITNKDLVIFLDELNIEGTKLVNKEGSIYSDNKLTIQTGDVDNTDGEIVGQGTLNITGFNLLDNTRGIIDSRGNILLSGNKLLNNGEVSGQYRLYWETWDGRIIYDDVWRDFNDTYMQTGNSNLITVLNDWIFTEGRSNMQGWGINPKDELNDINNDLDYKLYYGNLTSSQLEPTKNYMTQVLTGYVDTSRLITNGGRVLSGGNLTLDIVELENVNSKISAGGTLLITDRAQIIKNETTASSIKVFDGEEQVKTWTLRWTAGNGDTRNGTALGVTRGLKTTGRDLNIADSVSVIEGNNVVIQGSPVISNGYVIQSGAVVDPSTITSKDVDVDLYYDPVTVQVDRTAVINIINTGIIPFNNQIFNQSISKLFTQNSDPTSKYMLETRSQYIDLSRFFGSDYFLSKIGYDENSDWNKARRLGDAYYETKYMNNLLLETLGTRFINGKADTELMKE